MCDIYFKIFAAFWLDYFLVLYTCVYVKTVIEMRKCYPPLLTLFACVCVCVCERERESAGGEI